MPPARDITNLCGLWVRQYVKWRRNPAGGNVAKFGASRGGMTLDFRHRWSLLSTRGGRRPRQETDVERHV
jgi:hypothetical protein